MSSNRNDHGKYHSIEQQLPSRPFIRPQADNNEEMGTETVYRLSTNYEDGMMGRASRQDGISQDRRGALQSAGTSRKLRSAGRDAVGASTEMDYEPRADYPEPSPRYTSSGQHLTQQQQQRNIRSRDERRGAGDTYIDYSEYGL